MKILKFRLFLFFVFYQLGWLIASPLLIFLLVKRVFQDPLFARWALFGCGFPKGRQEKIIWFHAASVGEVSSLAQLLKMIETKYSDHRCFISVSTESAYQVAASFVNKKYCSRVPFDFLPFLLLAFFRLRPTRLVLVEGEIWPGLICLSSFLGIPVIHLNAKLSARSARRFAYFSFITSPLFKVAQVFYAQSQEMATRFIALGAAPDRVKLLGNLKAYNVYYKKKACTAIHHLSKREQTFYPARLDYQGKGPLLLVGSVHPGEIDYYITLFVKISQEYPDARFILVPRHFSWLAQLEKKLSEAALSYAFWSRDPAYNWPELLINNKVLVVAFLGQLFYLYQYATIFYLGGTFIPVGGHNLLEPPVWGCCSIVGPFHQNCLQEVEVLAQERAVVVVQDVNELITATRALLADDDARKRAGERAQEWLSIEKNHVKKLLEHDFLRRII